MTPKELFDAIMDPEKRTRVLFDGVHHRLITETVGSTDELCEVLCAVNWHAHAHYSLAPEPKPWDDEQWWADRFPHWVDYCVLDSTHLVSPALTGHGYAPWFEKRAGRQGLCVISGLPALLTSLYAESTTALWRPGRKPLDEAFGDQR